MLELASQVRIMLHGLPIGIRSSLHICPGKSAGTIKLIELPAKSPQRSGRKGWIPVIQALSGLRCPAGGKALPYFCQAMFLLCIHSVFSSIGCSRKQAISGGHPRR